MIRLIAITAAGAAIVLALVVLALRRQERRAAAAAAFTEDEGPFAPMWRPAFVVEQRHEPDSDPAWWWAVGALSDVRRRVAAGDPLTDPLADPTAGMSLVDAVIWHSLTDEWPTIHARMMPRDVGPHGGTGFALAGHAHQDADALAFDGRYAAEVPA